MAEGLNKVILIGNLGMDPELKYTTGGQAILRMRLATTERFQRKSGERGEKTEWHTVIMWGARGEALNKILSKGRTICVEGRIEYRQWEDKDGNKRTTTEINANNIVLVGSGGGRPSQPAAGGGGGGGGGPDYDEGGGAGAGGGGGGGGAGGGGGDVPDGDFGDDDIPF